MGLTLSTAAAPFRRSAYFAGVRLIVCNVGAGADDAFFFPVSDKVRPAPLLFFGLSERLPLKEPGEGIGACVHIVGAGFLCNLLFLFGCQV